MFHVSTYTPIYKIKTDVQLYFLIIRVEKVCLLRFLASIFFLLVDSMCFLEKTKNLWKDSTLMIRLQCLEKLDFDLFQYHTYFIAHVEQDSIIQICNKIENSLF